jgi:cytoskeleton protein RodZ
MIQSNEFAPSNGASSGAVLRRAREAAGLSIEQAATQLKMTVRAVANLESDDWSSLGAPVFVRGQLRSYARLLNVDIEPLIGETPVAIVAPSTLVSHSHTPRYRRFAEQVTRRAIYVAITAAIAVPVWFGMRPHLTNDLAVQSLEIPAATVDTAAETDTPKRTPLVASMAPIAPQPAVAQPALSLAFTGDSWVQVYAADGRQLEQGLLSAGQQRSYAAGEVGRVVLGNSTAVEVKRAGTTVDLSPFSRANVARFTLSSDGSLAPVAD